jgi:hypothetical protein
MAFRRDTEINFPDPLPPKVTVIYRRGLLLPLPVFHTGPACSGTMPGPYRLLEPRLSAA